MRLFRCAGHLSESQSEDECEEGEDGYDECDAPDEEFMWN